mmetsp:Transcript_17409/g.42945  ORF Transcript_17409/g.42945 Transcript_17409/m.42945 type:complete len:570 (+) Transcript_17409:178-1887(+)
MTPDEELADLQKKYALLEGDRKAYFETSQWTMKQNKETVAACKRENKELRAALGNQHASMDKPKPAELEQGSEELFKLQLFTTELRKRYDDIKQLAVKKTKELEGRIDGIKDLERDAVRPAEQDTPMTRHIRMLENRFDKALIKYNEAQSIRKTYEQIVKRLREERVGFDNQLGALERTLKAKEHDLEELILMSHDANHAKEIAKSELGKVDLQLLAERQQREKDLQERRAQVRARQEMNAKMSHRDNMRRDIKSEAQGDLSGAQEGVLKTAVVANALFHEQNEVQIREEQNRIGSFEEAFQKIKEATGVSDVNQVIQKFMTQEDTNNNLKQLTKEAQGRIDSLNEDKEAIRSKLEELKYSDERGPNRRAVDEYESQLTEGASKNDRVRLKFERIAKVLITMKAGTEHLNDKLEGIKHEGPAIPMSDETVVDVMAVCEQKLLKALEALGGEEESAKAKASAHKMALLSPGDVSEHNIRVEVMADQYGDDVGEEEEDEDDDGDGVDDDVPDRDYVKNSSQQMSDKVGRKTKKKNRYSSSEVPDSPSAKTRPPAGGAVKGKASTGRKPAMA